MRRFSSYGPLYPRSEFFVNRQALVDRVVTQLVGHPDEARGHYFTIFAPRQAGKTTTLREAVARIKQQYGDQYQVGIATLHQVSDIRTFLPLIFDLAFEIKIDTPADWQAMHTMFGKEGPLKKPTILILDEFDGLPPDAINDAVTFFRQLYLQRDRYLLHGLALIGVHAVLGTLEKTNSPFNVQRSLPIPNLTHDEVVDLYGQYQRESGQLIEPAVVERIYDLMRGQPGLTCWFGEILTEKTNPADPTPYDAIKAPEGGYPPITLEIFEKAQQKAQYLEWNTNIRNLLQKADQQKDFLVQLFYSHDIPFLLHNPQVQWLFLNGLIAAEESPDIKTGYACVFASPFVQMCIFSAFSDAMLERMGYFEGVTYEQRTLLRERLDAFDMAGLLTLYRAYLARQVRHGAAPWEQQPLRNDARAYEAIGHFNLYAWLYLVSRQKLVITPEFRTCNGTADLVVTDIKRSRRTVLEIKSFSTRYDHEASLEQVACYAKRMRLTHAFLVVMVDESGWRWLKTQLQVYTFEGITVFIEPIAWGWVEGERPRSLTLSTQEGIQSEQPPGEPLSNATPASRPRKAGTHKAGTGKAGTGKRKPARMSLDDRLALEELVLPLLEGTYPQMLWTGLGFEISERLEQEPVLIWRELLNLCEAEQRLSDLLKLLVYTFPALKEAALIVRLRGQVG